MPATEKNLLTDLLGCLEVPFTPGYSARQFDSMSFRSLFGFQQLLKSYGMESRGFRFAAKEDMAQLPLPFVAETRLGPVVVSGISSGTVTYITEGVTETMPAEKFLNDCSGVALAVKTDEKACEPDYRTHRMNMIMVKLRNIGIVVGVAALLIYCFVAHRIWASWSTVAVMLLDMAGLVLCYMLVQKSLDIHTKAADKVCKVLQEGGCDTILKTSASKFFGIFGWSEVGFAYFSVSLITLLVFPEWTGYLALCNLCCLPFTLWSIWYQRFRAHAWCTLCVSVQCTLWLLFFCYLGGGWLDSIFPLQIQFFVLGVSYVTVLLILNRILPYFHPSRGDAPDQTL